MSDDLAFYRKRPIVVRAYQHVGEAPVFIETLEGRMRAMPGDWIIEGVAGERYPCNDAIFRATYEAVDAATPQADAEALRELIDAAIEWALCPAAGSYKDGPAIEDTCERLGAAVTAYLGIEKESPPNDWWTLDEMRAYLAAKDAP